MSIILLKIAATAFLLGLFVMIIAALFLDKDDLMYSKWEEWPMYSKVIGSSLVVLVLTSITSVIGAFIAKVWGF